MVHCVRRSEHVGIVAILADGRRRDVRRVSTRSVCTVVAAGTVAGNIDVIKIRRYPSGGGVTIVAIITAVHVGRVLAGRRYTVMTGTACPQYLRMINRKHGCPDIRVMAVLAHVRSLNMRRTLARCLHAVVATNAISRDVYVVEIRRQPTDC